MRRLGTIVLCILLWTQNSAAVNYIFDEFLFSKDTWPEWKLDNPLEEMNPSDHWPQAKESFPDIENSDFNSLDGPRLRLPASAKPRSPGGGMEVDPLDDETLVEPAAKAAQCTTCHVLMAVLWNRLTAQLLSGETVTPKDVLDLMATACEKDALDAVLRKHTILKMESTAAGLSPSGIVEPTTLTFFVMRERRGGSRGPPATEVEETAVELSCKMLYLEYGTDLMTVIMTQLENFKKEAMRLYVKHGRDGGGPDDQDQDQAPAVASADSAADAPPPSGTPRRGSGSRGHLPRLDGGGSLTELADENDEYVDPDELDEAGEVKQKAAGRGTAVVAGSTAAGDKAPEGPRAVRGLKMKVLAGETECADLSPQCASWATAGECTTNPNYMIGTDKHRGQCRKSCGVCRSDDVLSSLPSLAADLDALSSALLLAVRNLGCGAGGPCLTGVSGMALGAGLVKSESPAQQPQVILDGDDLPPGMTRLSGGFILGKPWWAKPDVRLVPAAQRKDLPTTSAAEVPSEPSLSAPQHSEVDRVLSGSLAHRLLTIPSDFFTYEYLYKNHTRHFHEDASGRTTEDWLLGRFTRESVSLMSSATGEVAGLEELDLLPGSGYSPMMRAHVWPYVKQVYAGGDECVLGGGRRVVRRVEARIACSPDSQLYMLIREPDFCSYTFVIFVPQLCELEYYKPRPKEGSQSSVTGRDGGEGGDGEGQKKRRLGHSEP